VKKEKRKSRKLQGELEPGFFRGVREKRWKSQGRREGGPWKREKVGGVRRGQLFSVFRGDGEKAGRGVQLSKPNSNEKGKKKTDCPQKGGEKEIGLDPPKRRETVGATPLETKKKKKKKKKKNATEQLNIRPLTPEKSTREVGVGKRTFAPVEGFLGSGEKSNKKRGGKLGGGARTVKAASFRGGA